MPDNKDLYVVAFTGHRPPKIGGYNANNAIRVSVRQAIGDYLAKTKEEQLALDRELVVISGGALGVDQDAAILANQQAIRFIIAAPCIGQADRWPSLSQETYKQLQSLANPELAKRLFSYPPKADDILDGTVLVRRWYFHACMQKRNEWMTDHSDVLAAVWDGSQGGTCNCVQYARSIGKPVEIIWKGLN